MLIDGRKVLYSVKAKKLVYPEIPTEGLVCYLDARGKTNNDKHKGTLIDLSGNGNHGTLENFSFTDGSGYENGGLKFDGVDDLLSTANILTEGTLFFKFKINKLDPPNNGIYMICENRFVLYYQSAYSRHIVEVHADETKVYAAQLDVQTDITIVLRVGNGKYKVQINDFVKEVAISNPTIPTVQIGNSKAKNRGSDITANKFMAYSRVLTDEEIQQLLTA